MPINRIQTINKSTPYVSLSDDANKELDGFFDFLFDGHLNFTIATEINKKVSLYIDTISKFYTFPTRILGKNNYFMNILGYGYIQYSCYYDKYGKPYIYITKANFGGHRPYVPSATTPIRTPLIKTRPQIKYKSTGEAYFGFKIGYNKNMQKYNILNKKLQPVSKDPMPKKPRFFKRPFGKYNIVAHCNIGGWLWAMDINGKFYFMHKMWKEAYLYEAIKHILNEFINKRLLTEGYRSHKFRLTEKDLRWIIRRTLNEITKIA